ncbi:TauD/TfdA dioxygenase family protein [Pantoea vagans]|uniref:TauD/TfdA dioxygenase family protein n=1 Tax=Pantoea vagans TaxID=470934 RepID=UPI0023AEC4E8|nr:TauD/TfdA family dioxygenase [Pantoea vagans]MDE8559188.1 TauD/TfdA family dioxygenase [Pantoea vagans]MDE8579183.1 TauD/TfdA family dioxygenase [Pantoea vagans]
MLELRPLTDHIGMEVMNVDATQPIDAATFAELRSALNTHSVLLLRNQPVSEAQHVAFAREFGELQVHVLSQYLTTPYPELYVLSNVKQDGKAIGNHKEGWNWHSDWSYYEVPCFGSVLHAVEVPPVGADTLFSSMFAAYDTLDEETKQLIKPLSAVHSYSTYYAKAFADREPLSDEQKAKTPDVVHPLVRRHQETGRPSLFVGQDIVKEIVGLSPEESEALLARLNAHAISESFTYRHKWQAHDLLIWDNRCTMHQATPYDDVAYRRVMHRATVKGSERPQALV